MDKWITNEAFQHQVEKQKEDQEVTPWLELQEGKIFIIKKVEQHTSIYGACHLMYIEDQEANQLKVWAPGRLVSYIQRNKKPKQVVFFCSMGKERIDKKRSRNLFDVTFKDTEKLVELFVTNNDDESV